MWSELANNSKLEKIIISTGNILNVNTAAPLRKPHEELLDSLKLCAECQRAAETAASASGCELKIEYKDSVATLSRASRELEERIKEHKRSEIVIGTKLFLNKSSTQVVQEAVNALLQVLKVDNVDNLVLAYHPLETASKTLPESPDVSSSTASHVDYFMWSKRNEKYLKVLNSLWAVLQESNENNRVCQLGIADLDVDALKKLHENARVPPTINQVNLSKCCVVPQDLKDFCTQHDIQLLTHGDPEILISDEDFVIPNYAVDWSLRYQIHLRCRGVLTVKGYILQASKLPQNPTSGE